MKMYRLEDRILFDGAAAADVTEQLDKDNNSGSSSSSASSTDATVNSDSISESDASVQSDVAKDASSESSVSEDLLTAELTAESSMQPSATFSEKTLCLDEINNAVTGIIEGANLDSSLDSLATGDWPLTTGHEIAFINSSVMDAQKIIDSLGNNVDVVTLDSGKDGLQQITDYLAAKDNVSAVHIITHGNEGYITLNGKVIDSSYVESHTSEFAQWQNSLTPDADILIYSCNTAKGADGEAFVSRIASVTGADVAASVDNIGGAGSNYELGVTNYESGTTNYENSLQSAIESSSTQHSTLNTQHYNTGGSPVLHSDWNLEYQIGTIEAKSIAVADYDYHLANQIVTSNADSGAGTLRQAISDVSSGGEITFALGFGSETITISSELDITRSMTIDGDNTAGSGTDVTVQVTTPGLSSYRAIYINTGLGTVNIENMSVRGGDVSNDTSGEPFGGGILINSGTVSLSSLTIADSKAYDGGGLACGDTTNITRCTFTNNYATDSGGGLYSYSPGATITISDSTFSDNHADVSGGGIYNESSALVINNSTIAHNYADYDGSGSGYGGGLYSVGAITIKNTILADNYKGYDKNDYYNSDGTVTDNGYNIVGVSTGYTWTGTGDWTDQSGSGTFTKYGSGESGSLSLGWMSYYGGKTKTINLYDDSIAINNGYSSDATLETDQRGLYIDTARTGGIHNRTIGAYEYNAKVASIDGTYYNSLGAAISAASSGDAIQLVSGYLYTGMNFINKNISIAGNGADETYLQSGLSYGHNDNMFYIGEGYSLNISDATIKYGGGSMSAISNSGTLTIDDCTLEQNYSMSGGGAINNNSSGTLTITDSTINSNTAYSNGGAIYNNGAFSISNTTISGNLAKGSGGAIYSCFYDGAPAVASSISNSTIAYNHADNDDSGSGVGGGYCYEDPSSTGTDYLTMRNTIIANNYTGSSTSVRSDYYNPSLPIVSDGGYNVVGVSEGHTWTGTGDWTLVGSSGDTYQKYGSETTGLLILASSLADNGGDTLTLSLGTGSIAVDAIPKGAAPYYNNSPAADQRGVTRTGDYTSIGAYSESTVTEYYYKTKDGGGSLTWSTASDWLWSTDQVSWTTATESPNSDNSLGITIQSDANVSIASDVTIDQTTINSGGAITVVSGTILTIADGTGTDLSSNGSIINDGTITNNGSISVTGTYYHAGTVTGNALSYSGSSSTLIYSGSSQQITTAYEFASTGGPYNLTINNSSGVVLGFDRALSGNITVSSGSLNIGANTLTVIGTTNIDGTLSIGTGTFDADGTFDSSEGVIDFTGAGNLKLGGETITIYGYLEYSRGTVWYDRAGDQTIDSGPYYNLKFSGSGTKSTSTGGSVVAHNSLIVDTGVTLSVVDHSSVTANGETDINGTLLVTGDDAQYYAVGVFSSTDGTVTLNDNSWLYLYDYVVGFGTLEGSTGSICYTSSGAQNIYATIYPGNLKVGTGGTKSITGDTGVGGELYVGSDSTLSVGTKTVSVAGTTIIEGTLSISTGTLDANGDVNATGGTIDFTGAGNLKLGAEAITSLGNLDVSAGTVWYDRAGNQTIMSSYYNNLEISGSGTKTASSSGYVMANGVLTVDTGAKLYVTDSSYVTVYGASDINGTLQVYGSNGKYQAYGVFNSTDGTVALDNSGWLYILDSVGGFGTLEGSTGSIAYTASGAQDIYACLYPGNLKVGIGGTKTITGNTSVTGQLYVGTDSTLSVGSNTVAVTGLSQIEGTLSISTGTLDANGDVNATGGTIDFTGAGNLKLGAETITSLGTLDETAGTVWYDRAGDQTIMSTYYNNLEISGSGTKTASSSGYVMANGALTVDTGAKLYVTDSSYVTVHGASDINGTLQVYGSNGKYQAYGVFNSTDGTVALDNSGWLYILDSVGGFGTLEGSTGSIAYTASGAQDIYACLYPGNLKVGIGGTKTITGDTSVTGQLYVGTDSTLSVGSNTVAVTGLTQIEGILSISTGTLDANGDVNATGGTIDFTGAGNLKLGAEAITCLGTLDETAGTVWYDRAGDQSVASLTYYNLKIDGTGTKTATGNVAVNNILTVTSLPTFDVNANLTVSGSIASEWFIKVYGTATLPSDAAITGYFFYDGQDQTIAPVASYANLYLSGSYTKTSNSNLTVLGSFANNAHLLDVNGNFTVGETITNNASIYVSGNASLPSNAVVGGIFKYDGTSTQTIASVASYDHLYLGEGTKIANSNLHVLVQLSTFSGAILDVNGNLTDDTYLNMSDNSYIYISGDADIGYNMSEGTGTIVYDGASQAVADITYVNLDIAGIGTKTAAFDLLQAASLSVQENSTLDMNGDLTVTSSFTNTGTIYMSGAHTTVPTGTELSGTFIYDGGLQITGDLRYGNVIFAGTNTKRINYDLYASGCMTVNESVSLEVNRDLSVDGVLTNNGSIQIGYYLHNNVFYCKNTVTGNALVYIYDASLNYCGSTAQTVSSIEFPGTYGPKNVTISNTAGVYLDSDTTVSGTLTVSLGELITGANTLTVNGHTVVSGILTISEGGTLDANAVLTVTGTLANSGSVQAASTVSLSQSTIGGIFKYDGTDQTVQALSYNTLQLSGSGSTKTFADGTTKVAHQISITESMTLSGSSSDNVTVQVTTPGEGGTASRVFYIHVSGEQSVTLENMAIRGGDISSEAEEESNSGGSIYVKAEQDRIGQYSTINFNDIVVSGSKALNGGGIYLDLYWEAVTNITGSSFIGNSAETGGAVYSKWGSDLSVSNSTFTDNTASENYKGGIYRRYGKTTIEDSTFTNSGVYQDASSEISISGSTFDGDGVYTDYYGLTVVNSRFVNCREYGIRTATNQETTCTITNTTVSGCTSYGIYNAYSISGGLYIDGCTVDHNGGGGIYSAGRYLSIANSTIADNSGTNGGGIVSYSSSSQWGASLLIVNSTVSGNTATGNGGGIYISGYVYYQDILNSIIINNSAASGEDIYQTGSSANLALYYSWYDPAKVRGTLTTQATAPNVTTPYANGNLGSLHDNGGPTYTMAVAAGAPINGTGTFAYYNSSDKYYFVDNVGVSHKLTNWDVSPVVSESDKITTDQRGEIRDVPPVIGAYGSTVSTMYYFRSRNSGAWSSIGTWQESSNQINWTNATVSPDVNALGIEIRSNNNVTVSSALSIDQTTIDRGGTLTVSDAGSLTIATGEGVDLTINGTLLNNGAVLVQGEVENSGTITNNTTVTNTGTIDNYGTFTNASVVNNTGTITSEDGSTFAYTGNFNQDVLAGIYYNLTLIGAGTTKTAASAVTVNNALTVNSNVTFDATDLTVSRTIINSGDIYASGSVSLPARAAVGGSFYYDGTDQDIAPVASYNYLYLSGGNKTATLTLTVNNTLYVGSDVTLDAVNLTASRTLSNSGIVEVSGAARLPSRTNVGTFHYDGDSAQTLAAGIYTDLRLKSAGAKTLGGNTTVSGNLKVDNVTTFYVNSGTLSLAGNADINGALSIGGGTLSTTGTFDATGGEVIFTGSGALNLGGTVTSLGTSFAPTKGTVNYNGSSDQAVLGGSYYNLSLSGSGTTKTGASALTISNTLTVGSGVTLDANEALTVTRTLTNSGTINAYSSVSLPAASSVGGIFTYDGADQIIASVSSYTTLNLSGTGTVSTGGLTARELTVGADVVLSDTDKLAVSRTISNNGTIDVAGKVTLPANSSAGNFIYRGGTVKSSQGIAAATYGDLTISGAAKTALSGKTTVNGTITVEGTLSAKTHMLNLSGSFLSSGTFNANTGTINYTGMDQHIADLIYYNLTLSGTGTNVAPSDLIMTGSLIVGDSATLSAENLTVTSKITNSGTVNVSGEVSLPRSQTIGGTFSYTGNGDKTIVAATYDTLCITGTGTKTFESGTTKVSNEIDINDSMTLAGTISKGKLMSTVQVASPGVTSSRVFSIGPDSAATVTIQDMYVKGGNVGSGYGGAIFIQNGSAVTLDDVAVSGSKAAKGAGIYNDNSTLAIQDYSSISSNTATDAGGGIYNKGGTLIVSESTISSNKAAASDSCGGGIENYGGSCTLTNVTVSSNTATGRGGGISNDNDGDLTISCSTISANKAAGYKAGKSTVGGTGGGIFDNGDTIISNSTIHGNSAYTAGGGLSFYSGSLGIRNSTIANNSATSALKSGGGIYAYYSDAGEMSIRNSIVANNSSKGVRQDTAFGTDAGSETITINDQDYNVIGISFNKVWTGTGDWTLVGTSGDKYTNGTITGSLKLSTTPGSNGGSTQTLSLNAKSFATAGGTGAIPVDAGEGNYNNSPTTDQRGVTRTGDSTSIGAYNKNASVLLPLTLVTLPGLKKMKNRKHLNPENPELVNDCESIVSIFDRDNSSFTRICKHSAFKSDVENLLEQVIA